MFALAPASTATKSLSAVLKGKRLQSRILGVVDTLHPFFIEFPAQLALPWRLLLQPQTP